MRLIRREEYRQMQWKNGGGVTHEIAVEPPGHGVGEPFAWRLSMAQVDGDGPFSAFVGYERILTLLGGAGMDLDFGAHGRVALRQPLQQAHFPGEWPVACTLAGGPVTDLNLIVDRRRLAAQAQIVSATGAPLVLDADTALLFAPRGGVRVSAPGLAEVALPALGTLVLHEPPAHVTLHGDAAHEAATPVCLFRLRTRGGQS